MQPLSPQERASKDYLKEKREGILSLHSESLDNLIALAYTIGRRDGLLEASAAVVKMGTTPPKGEVPPTAPAGEADSP